MLDFKNTFMSSDEMLTVSAREVDGEELMVGFRKSKLYLSSSLHIFSVFGSKCITVNPIFDPFYLPFDLK